MKKGGKKSNIKVYPCAAHAFFKHCGVRYKVTADAGDARATSLAFLREHLK